MSPTFDEHGLDSQTYAPFTLHNCLDSEWHDVRLSFSDWTWLQAKYGTESVVDEYYLNGYGIEGLVKAVLFEANVDLESDDIEFDSEGDTCYIHFQHMDQATHAAALAAAMISQEATLKAAIAIAREEGFED